MLIHYPVHYMNLTHLFIKWIDLILGQLTDSILFQPKWILSEKHTWEDGITE